MNRIVCIILLACIGISSCKKPENSNPGGSACKLLSYNYASTNTYYNAQHIIVYDSQGRIIADSIPGKSTARFTYNGSTVVVDNPEPRYRYEITLNSAGLPANVSAYDSAWGFFYINHTSYTPTYGSNNPLISIKEDRIAIEYNNNPGHPDTSYISDTLSSVQYDGNGNITSAISSLGSPMTISYQYYTDKSYSAGADPVAKLFAINGSPTNHFIYSGFGWGFIPQVFSKNLIKSISYANSYTQRTLTFTYTFDQNNNISVISISADETSLGSPQHQDYSYTMAYDCQ